MTWILSFFIVFICNTAQAVIQEGTPIYYNKQRTDYSNYTKISHNTYVGSKNTDLILSRKEYSYKMPKSEDEILNGGVSLFNKHKTNVYAKYSRVFADFQFETGVKSVLEWDDMLINEIKVGVKRDFEVRDFDMFTFAEYSVGKVQYGGMSMDYDLKAYNSAKPNEGIFTISVGDLDGSTNRIKFGLGAKHVWNINGWKFSPSIGYEIFSHNLQMMDHIYPNPAVFLPLMTDKGDYIYGDSEGKYYTVPVGVEPDPSWYQVCMSPEDIKVVPVGKSGTFEIGNVIKTKDYDSSMGTLPWNVAKGECVVIGADGELKVPGVTHKYNTTWSGIYLGLEVEKQMTFVDKLRFYLQVSMPQYLSEGIWPNRTDWQQNPSFIDKGNNGSFSYLAEMEYSYNISDRIQLSLKAGTNYFYVGKIGGELYVAEYTRYLVDEHGQYILDPTTHIPKSEKVSAHTEEITDSLLNATWRSFNLELGVKYAF